MKDESIFFSRRLLKWVISYLSDRRFFVQIDYGRSDFARVTFDVPQRSILGPVIFNLYVTDPQAVRVEWKSFQYADETTLFGHAKIRDLSGAIDTMNRRLDRVGAYSREADLAVNATKTKWMLVSTP